MIDHQILNINEIFLFNGINEIIKPYDITSWSLPLHRGVKVNKINTYSEKLDKSLAKPELLHWFVGG